MKCPFCGDPDSRVIDSRAGGDGGSIRRRRECESCKRRFTTYEHPEEFIPVVVKKNGQREEFRRTKVLEGLIRACEKTSIPLKDLEGFVDGLLGRIQDRVTREVETQWIGDQVMDFLRDKDPVAYVRFASVYRKFTDITAFQDEIKTLLGRRKRSRRSPKKARARKK